jgi:hypothetical protein
MLKPHITRKITGYQYIDNEIDEIISKLPKDEQERLVCNWVMLKVENN